MMDLALTLDSQVARGKKIDDIRIQTKRNVVIRPVSFPTIKMSLALMHKYPHGEMPKRFSFHGEYKPRFRRKGF